MSRGVVPLRLLAVASLAASPFSAGQDSDMATSISPRMAEKHWQVDFAANRVSALIYAEEVPGAQATVYAAVGACIHALSASVSRRWPNFLLAGASPQLKTDPFTKLP